MLNLPTKKPTICSINVPLFVGLSTKLSKLLFQSSNPNKNASPEKEDQRNSGVAWVTTLLMVPMCFHDAHQSLVNHYMVFFLHPPECLQRILIFTRQMHQKDRGASFPLPPKKIRFRSTSTVPVEHSHAPNQIYASFENPFLDLHLGM